MMRWLRALLGRPPDPDGPESAPSRNDPCPCGSGRKYKRCCRAEDQRVAVRAQRRRRSAQQNEPLSKVITGDHEPPTEPG